MMQHGDPNEAPRVRPKIIYVELDDEVTAIFDHITRAATRIVTLVIPAQAAVLQSSINLKLLKKKIDALGKEVRIVTVDTAGRIIAEKVGFSVSARLTEDMTALPKNPRAHTAAGERPIRMTAKKISIAEFLISPRQSLIDLGIARFKDYMKRRRLERKGNSRIIFSAPNKQALFTLILVSIFLLVSIAYIALPGATIYITPRSSILDPSFNITFIDAARDADIIASQRNSASIVIPSYEIAPPPFTKTISRQATGKAFRGTNAQGLIVITNLSPTAWDLAERTRFQTNEGIVFRISAKVTVPPAKANSPGRLEATVRADEFDTLGQPIGDRGNIGPTQFFLPGLKNEENKKNLYGESFSPMSGGTTSLVTSVSEQDILAATESIKKEMTKIATGDLMAALEEHNHIQNTNLTLLTDRHLLKISEPEIQIPENIAKKVVDSFDVRVTYSARSIAYDKQELLHILKERVRSRRDPDKKIIRIDENDISYRFLDEDVSSGKARLTATIRALQIHELDPTNENGVRFMKKILDHIVGMRIPEAVEYLQQQTDEIARVSIKTWPVWSPTIPNVQDNITFVIVEEPDI